MSILDTELTPEMGQSLVENAKQRGLEAKAYAESVVLQNLQEKYGATSESKKQDNVMDFYGVGHEAWTGVDVQEYINEMRDEWDAPR